MENITQNMLEEDSVDIKKFIYLILGHWWWFAIAIFISFTIAYLINRYSQQIYSVSCTIIVGEPESEIGSIESVLDEFSRKRSKKRMAVVENEVSILKSYKMARMALEELDFEVTYTSLGRRNIAESRLYNRCPFKVILDTSKPLLLNEPIYVTILSNNEYLLTIGDDFRKTSYFGDYVGIDNHFFKIVLRDPENFDIKPNQLKKYYFDINDINSQSKAYRNRLNVEVNAEKGSVLTLSKSGYVPEKIADYLNKLCEVYIRANLKEKNITSENTIHFIDNQLRGVVDSLEATGLRLQRFRSANKVINLSEEGTYLFQKMQELQTESATYEIKEKYYNYLLDYIKNKKDYSDVVAPSVVGIEDQLLNELVRNLNQLNLERRELHLSVFENSPQTLNLNSQIKNILDALQENLLSRIEGNKIAISDLIKRIENIESEIQKLPGTERQLINIEREFTINDQIYTFLLEKRAEAGITKASNTSDHKILDIAQPQNASIIKPNTSMNYMIAIVSGVATPLILLLLIEFFNTKINDRNHLENKLNVPIIGNIGHNEKGTELPVNENPGSSLTESFRELRTNLQYIFKVTDVKSKVIAISSAISGEGKTFTSVNLACILALAGNNTLLLSLDLRRPKIHKIFNLNNKEGISTFLINKSNSDDIIYPTNINNLFVATSGPIPPNPAELLGSEKMKDFIKNASEKFDYVILDTPPIGIVTDALALKESINTFIFVIRHNYSEKHVIELINGISSKKLLRNVGVIVNDIQVKGYYGYSYRYSYGYGYNYSNSYRNAYYQEEKEFSRFLKFIKKK